MLEGICNALSVVTVVLAVCYLLCIFLLQLNNYNEIRSIKVRILLSSILFVVFIPKTIISIILGESKLLIILDIICIILWALSTISGFFALKELKEKQLNTQSADEDVIDINCEEVQDDETEKDEP